MAKCNHPLNHHHYMQFFLKIFLQEKMYMPHSLFEIVKMHKTTQLPPRILAFTTKIDRTPRCCS